LKLAFVVQRYGADIAGGSEAHCRELAHRLAGRHDITVLTTGARDYVTWENVLPVGTSLDGPVRVIRFPVARQRRLKAFADLDDQLIDDHGPGLERAWFEENGPIVPALLDHLRQHGTSYDVVLFWTFRYYPSFFGLPLVADRAVLIPTAEDDRTVTLGVLEEFFRSPAGFLFMTPEEEVLVADRAGRTPRPSQTIGIGIDPAQPIAGSRALLDKHGIPSEYVLYLGRVDRNKGCGTLFDYFQDYAAHDSGPSLVLAGPAKMQIPAHPRITALGYVSDELRTALLSHALALLVPSPYESLSIVLLEAWNFGVPAVVNAFCKVLRGQVRRANGGVYYRSSREFTEALRYLRAHSQERTALGQSGLAFVEREYRWPTVIARVEALLTEVRARMASATAAAARPAAPSQD
jgi:glycosyltransferase involved in cell wall biosynthesis